MSISTRSSYTPALIAIAAAAACGVHAEEPVKLTLNTVQVTATRQETRVNEVIADVTVIDRDTIEQAGSTTLPELLSRQAGLNIVTNGGIGKNASIFMRGTSSGHTLLLVDGMQLGSVTTGSASIANLPLSQIDRIEILRGPASSLYGSDAIGGVIQVFTRRGDGPTKLNAYAGAGSYGTREVQAGLSGTKESLSYAFNAAQLATDGFNVAAAPDRYRAVNGTVPSPDADGYRNTSYSARLNYALAPGHEIGLSTLEASSRNHTDSGGPTIDAYSNDKTRVQGVYLRNRVSDAWTSTIRWGLSEDNSERYEPTRTLFATTQTQWSWQNDVKLPLGTLLVAAENVEQGVNSTTRYVVTRRTVRSLILGYQGNIGAHSWQSSIRRDQNSQFGGRTTASLAYGYRFNNDWQARASVGTAFKAPSFNQLYFPGFGSANLLPETARNREVGLNWNRGQQQASLTLFDNRIENLIVGSPAVNINRARITGTSVGYGADYLSWRVDSSLDLMRPVDEITGARLQRRPAEMLKTSIIYAPGTWRVGSELTAIGRRYDTTTQGRIMGGYAVVNLLAAHAINRNWSLEGRINNLFGRVYENAWSYAVPGRELFVGLRYTPR